MPLDPSTTFCSGLLFWFPALSKSYMVFIPLSFLGGWLAAGSGRVSSVPWQPREETPPLGASNTASPAVKRGDYTTVFLHQCSLTWSAVGSSEPCSLTRMWVSLDAPKGGQKSWWKCWKISCEEELRTFSLFGGEEAEGWPHNSLQLSEEGKCTSKCWSCLQFWYPVIGHVGMVQSCNVEV